jgi:DNA-binding CsgD family transcriptional regulator
MNEVKELPILTNREKQVLEHLLVGESVTGIARKFNLKSNTISTIKINLLKKFRAKNLIDLIKILDKLKINSSEFIHNLSILSNEEKSLKVKNSDSFFEMVNIGGKSFIIEYNHSGNSSIYRKVI